MQFNPTLDSIKTYEAGKPIELVVREYGIKPQNVIKLASNENPFGASPKVIEAIAKEAVNAHRYPDDSMFELKEGLAGRFGVKSENVIIGSGSDQILEMAVHAKCSASSKVLMSKTTFAMYEVYSRQVGARILRTPSDQHHLGEFWEIYQKERPEILFLCLPNNPLGECLDREEVYDFLQKIDDETLVIVDGAYQEYAAFKDSQKRIDPKDLIERFPNSIFLGTFSKAFGLGGMRVGYGIAQPSIIQALMKMRAPFNITTLSLKAAIEALKESAYVEETIKENFKEMRRYEEFALAQGIDFIPSYTNFITLLLKNRVDSSEFSQWLLERGLIVRNLKSYGINAIRITIGRSLENDRCFELMQEYLHQF